MTLADQARGAARLELRRQIDHVATAWTQMNPACLAGAIDAIRCDARTAHFYAVAALATNLERALATTARAAMVRPYLDAMGDAVGSDDEAPARIEAWLGSVGARYL